MSIRTKRGQRFAVATAAALTVTAGLAVGGGTASADLYSPLDGVLDALDNLPDDAGPGLVREALAEAGLAGDIRVMPTDYDADDQTEYASNDQPFNFQLRGEDRPGENMQVVVKNKWEAGDQLKLIVYPDGYSIREVNGGDPAYREDDPNTSTGQNCATPTAGIGWSEVPTVSGLQDKEDNPVEGPFALNLNGPPPAGDDPLGMATFFNEGAPAEGPHWNDPNLPWNASYWGPVPPGAGWPAPPPVDVRTPGEVGLIAPEFSVSASTVSSSGDCVPAGVADVLTLTFENTSTNLGNPSNEYLNEWVVNLEDVLFDVGGTVPSGPAHVAVFPVDSPSFGAEGAVFGAYGSNMGQLSDNFITDTTIRQWTNPIFVQPAQLTVGANPELLIDGTPQFVADVTWSEDGPDGFGGYFGQPALEPSCFVFEFSQELDGLPTVTYNGGAPVSAALVGGDDERVKVCVNPTPGLDVIEMTDIAVVPQSDLPITVQVVKVPGAGQPGGDADTSFFERHLPDDRAGVLVPLGILQLPSGGDQDRALSASTISDVNAPAELTDVYPELPVANARGLGDRIGGTDRYETASKIANRLTECTNFAIIVSGQSYPDALSAAYLAGNLATAYEEGDEDERDRGPALRAVPILTVGDTLPDDIETFIRSRGVDTVYIVGGTAAVNQTVEDELAALPSWDCGGVERDDDGFDSVVVERVGGADRYDTNRLVIQLAQNNTDSVLWQARLRHQFFFGQSSQRTALMASGENFPDALAFGPISYGTTGCEGVADGDRRGRPGQFDRCKGFPLILTEGDALSPTAESLLDTIDIDTVVVAGGTAAVSAAVVTEMEAMGIQVIRLGGVDRIETATIIADWIRTGSNTFLVRRFRLV